MKAASQVRTLGLILLGMLAQFGEARAQRPPAAAEACGGLELGVSHVKGGAAPYVRLVADAKPGNFLLDWGTTRSSISQKLFPSASGTITIGALSLPGIANVRFLVRRYELFYEPPGGQAGIVGTDLLATFSAHLRYGESTRVWMSTSSCDGKRLAAAGYIAVRQTGYFGRALERNGSRPNVPILLARIGSVQFPAQIDSGYDDLAWVHSIDINEALHKAISGSGIELRLVQKSIVATCAGTESRDVFELRGDVQLVGGQGEVITTLNAAHLLPKPLNRCGGIAQMPEPMGQLAASVLRTLGEIIIDGPGESVWVMPRP